MMSTREGVTEIRLGELLGKGCFGRVHGATIEPHGIVAVKVIDCGAMADRLGISSWQELRSHLFAEANNLRQAEHQHVVRVHSVQHSPTRDEVFIVTERCDGTLGKLAEPAPVPLRVAATSLRHALLGLEALHQRGMIHRDLKPSNILRRGGTFKLGDFGLVTDNLVKGYATLQGYTEHLAPEAFTGNATSPATDVWAMGMTAFRVLNGEPWYAECLRRLDIDRDDLATAGPKIETLVASGRFAQKLRWMPHVPQEWRRFVNRALSANTTARFRDGAAMLSGMRVPHEPSWECTYEPELVRWLREHGDRQEVVEWHRSDPREHSFTAFTRGRDGRSRPRTLSRSTSTVPTVVIGELQRFFETRSV